MSDAVIRAEGIGKRYRIGARRASHGSLREAVVSAARRIATAPFRAAARLSGRPSSEDDLIWALKGVSFEVGRGEVMGVIGPNGAGKTTLLKVLSRITEPTEGTAEIRGRVGSLLEVGTGFHPELTGRENIYLNGAILGMKRREIRAKFDEIVSFAEIDRFIDTPIKRYSAGMYTRLAFAVAAHLEPEILLVDEVLAVGDAAFQKKCLGKMGDVAKEGRTVLFVSHNMGAVRGLCGRAILLEGGKIARLGPAHEIITRYLSEETETGGIGTEVWQNPAPWDPKVEVMLRGVSLAGNGQDGPRSSFTVDEPIAVAVDYAVSRPLTGLRIILQLHTSHGVVAFTSYEDSSVVEGLRVGPGDYRAECELPPDLLNIDRYSVLVGIDQPGVKALVPLVSTVKLQVVETSSHSRYPRRLPGAVRPSLTWRKREVESR
ncbi:MAG: ABC transporter ATP-binding protein [Planctomycetota bacterium]